MSKENKSPRKLNKTAVIILLILLVLLLPGLYSGLTIRKYEITTDKMEGRIRIALVTDLHACKYGEGQKKLLDAIEKQSPDVVLLGGDIFDDKREDGPSDVFLEAIAGKYDCYYVTGNHECWAGSEAFRRKMDKVESCGIKRLSGEAVLFLKDGAQINICGVDDPHITLVRAGDQKREFTDYNTQLNYLKNSIDRSAFNVLLTHRPELLDDYENAGFDLALAGHAHGGQWRIPWILNGLFAPNQGLFPKLAGGRYQKGNTTMIVSRGLARESTPVPRIYNPPELVIIEIQGQ